MFFMILVAGIYLPTVTTVLAALYLLCLILKRNCGPDCMYAMLGELMEIVFPLFAVGSLVGLAMDSDTTPFSEE